MNQIKRREALKKVGYLLGGVVSAPVLLNTLQGCVPEPGLSWTPQLFTEEEANVVTKMVDLIIPKTDTAGAVELGIPKYIEDMVRLVYPSRKGEFTKGLANFLKACESKMGSAFLDLDQEDQFDYLSQLNKNANRQSFYYKIKELSVTGFAVTEVGATQVMQYVAIPGNWDGCLPVDEMGGKRWATR
ncbi:MAG: gluconate 2-dehydrogenase subunit 3 family protein [Cyclobacteriaceae bacterium]